MNQSEQINELASALCRAQSLIDGAVMTKANTYHKNKYATLTDVWVCCKGALGSYGLAVCQTFEVVNGDNHLITTLMHTSGQWMRGSVKLPVTKNTAQDFGSSVTYVRRYTLCSLLQICPISDDDDGEEAMSIHRQPEKSRHMEKPKELGEKIETKKIESFDPLVYKEKVPVDDQVIKLHSRVCGTGLLVEVEAVNDFLATLCDRYPKQTRNGLIESALRDDSQVNKFADSLRKEIFPDKPAA